MYLGSAIDLINTYQLKQGSNLAVNPDTGVGWLEADLDATQVVVETV